MTAPASLNSCAGGHLPDTLYPTSRYRCPDHGIYATWSYGGAVCWSCPQCCQVGVYLGWACVRCGDIRPNTEHPSYTFDR